MKKFFFAAIDYLKRSDSLLFALCLACSVFGIILISSASRSLSSHSFVIVQSIALVLGIALYFLFSVIDVGIIADKWRILLVLSILLLISLRFFGVADDTGNRAWLRFGGIGIQPAEIVKIPFIIILAKQIDYLETGRGLNKLFSVAQLAAFFLLMFGLIIVISADLGSALVYAFIFAAMLFAAGLPIYWFLIAFGCVAAVAPYAWTHFLTQRQRDRILAPYDPSVDPTGLDILWQTNRSKAAIASGHIAGEGLYHGRLTQSGGVPKQHTDFIFSAAGEELGFIGCAVIILLLTLIIIRCIHVGVRSNDRKGMLVCVGVASILIFQAFANIGMCIGIAPVVGLTLPFFSYGGSSIVTMFAAMGIVSGVRLRRVPVSSQYWV